MATALRRGGRRSRPLSGPAAPLRLLPLHSLLTVAFAFTAAIPGFTSLGLHALLPMFAAKGMIVADEVMALDLVILLLSALAGASLGHLACRWLAPQIEHLTRAIETLEAGATQTVVPHSRVQEIDRLAQALASVIVRMTPRVAAAEPESRSAAYTRPGQEERHAVAARGANDGLWDWDVNSDTLYCSPRWHEIVGIEDAEALVGPSHWFDRVHPDDLDALRASLDDHLQGRSDQLSHEARVAGDGGDYRWTLCRGMALRRSDGTPYRLAGSLSDISERREAEERRRHESLHDPLTGLANRVLFLERLRHALRPVRAGRPHHVAVLLLDVDRFKVVNESLGREIGDDLLVATAGLVLGCVREVDTVARLGGDELAILLDGVSGEADAIRVAERTREALQQPVSLGGHTVFVTASIGIVLAATDEQPAEHVLRDAETAMYRAKELGRDRHVVFDPSLHNRAVSLLELESDVRLALERNELSLHYQPIVGATGLAVQAVEALIRWNRPGRPAITPTELIELAEQSGLIVSLGEWVLRRAIEQMRDWQAAGVAPERLAVNLSARQLQQADLPERIAALLDQAGLDAGCLELELTERMVAEQDAVTVDVLERLRALGLKLSVDDFGTGYSSLAYLTRFPVSTVKVDRAFLVDIQDDPVKQAIVQAVTTLAHAIGMHVVAEGIETTEQLELARSLGCDEVQGYLVSKPLPPEQATVWLGSQHTRALLLAQQAAVVPACPTVPTTPSFRSRPVLTAAPEAVGGLDRAC